MKTWSPMTFTVLALLVGTGQVVNSAVADQLDAAPAPASCRQTPSGSAGNGALGLLLDEAACHVDNHQYEQAVGTLERALRLAPRNAGLWQQLAAVHLLQGNNQQAEAMARKSSQLTDDLRLQRRNDDLIAAAQGKSGSPAELIEPDRLAVEIERRREANAGAEMVPERFAEESPRRQRYEMENRAAPRETSRHREGSERERRDRHSDDIARKRHRQHPTELTSAMPERGDRFHYRPLRIPQGHLPPPGICRIWFPDRPAGHQPPPGDCYELERRVPRGAVLVHG